MVRKSIFGLCIDLKPGTIQCNTHTYTHTRRAEIDSRTRIVRSSSFLHIHQVSAACQSIRSNFLLSPTLCYCSPTALCLHARSLDAVFRRVRFKRASKEKPITNTSLTPTASHAHCAAHTNKTTLDYISLRLRLRAYRLVVNAIGYHLSAFVLSNTKILITTAKSPKRCSALT